MYNIFSYLRNISALVSLSTTRPSVSYAPNGNTVIILQPPESSVPGVHYSVMSYTRPIIYQMCNIPSSAQSTRWSSSVSYAPSGMPSLYWCVMAYMSPIILYVPSLINIPLLAPLETAGTLNQEAKFITSLLPSVYSSLKTFLRPSKSSETSLRKIMG